MSVPDPCVKVQQVSPLALKIVKLLYVQGEKTMSEMNSAWSSRAGRIDAIEELRDLGLIEVRVVRDVPFYRLSMLWRQA